MQMDALTPHHVNIRRLRKAIALTLVAASLPVAASSLEQAKRIHDRLAGVPPSNSVLLSMQAKIDASDAIGAANDAMNNPAFYNATLKNWASPWTNRDDNKFAPLNDYTATVIGIVRDGLDYRRVLYDDIIYVPVGYGSYSNSNNNAYVALEAANGNMGSSGQLQQSTQSAVTGLTASATAGIATTRAAARAFFIDGTNRAMFRFTLKNHLCNDMEQVQEITRPTDRIRQDVSRSPGGDSRIFMNTCVGCHSGMDPMAQAFAYYNFAYTEGSEDSGQLEYTPGVVQPKYFINSKHFPEGFVTPNDHWDNYWRAGPNTAIFGWSNTHTAATSAARNNNGIYGDAGAKSMAEELANSEAFAVCSVKKVFKAVCLRDPSESDRTATVHGIAGFSQMLADFNTSHNLKQTFAQAAVYCSGN
jgi:hypothetical protein